MFKITLLSLCILLSVLLFVLRIFYHYKKQHIFPLKIMTKIGTFHVVLIFILYVFYFSQPFWFLIYCFVTLFAFPIFIYLFTKFLQHHFYSEFLRFLSGVILKMQMGYSFTSAMESCLGQSSWLNHGLLVHIYENVVFSQQEVCQNTGPFSRFINKMVCEFRLVHQNQHLAIDRLCKIQKNLQNHLFFRRKSRQIWSYFGYQIGILSFIYFGLILYVVSHFGFSKFQNIFLLSFGFYSLGVLFLYFLVRGKKWHI